MIIVVVRHILREGKADQARARLEANAGRMMGQPGILFRHTGASGDGRELVTVTGWRSEEDRRAWDALRRAAPPPGDMAEVYSGFETIDIAVYDARDARDLRDAAG